MVISRTRTISCPIFPINLGLPGLWVGLGLRVHSLFPRIAAVTATFRSCRPSLVVAGLHRSVTQRPWPMAPSQLTGLPSWHYWVRHSPGTLWLTSPLSAAGSWPEFGRQPWTIQDMLPTWAAVSEFPQCWQVSPLTFVLFLILFTTMLAVEINILLQRLPKDPNTLTNNMLLCLKITAYVIRIFAALLVFYGVTIGGAILVFLLFVQGANSVASSPGVDRRG